MIVLQRPANLRLYALCGMIAPILWASMLIVEQSLVPGYNWVSQFISDLGNYFLYGQYAVLQDLNFWVFGFLVVAFSRGLRRGLSGSRAVTTTLGVFGTMVFLGGLFPDEQWTIFGLVHGLVSTVAFLSIPIFQILTWLRLRHPRSQEESVWSRYAIYSLTSGLLSFVLIISQGYFPVGYMGIWQRLFLAVPWLWIELVAVKLFRLSSSEQ